MKVSLPAVLDNLSRTRSFPSELVVLDDDERARELKIIKASGRASDLGRAPRAKRIFTLLDECRKLTEDTKKPGEVAALLVSMEALEMLMDEHGQEVTDPAEFIAWAKSLGIDLACPLLSTLGTVEEAEERCRVWWRGSPRPVPSYVPP